jgi:hypothetical protein
MIELHEKDKKFEWMPACEASFQELKKRLTTAPVLVMPDMEKPFSIYCDMSGQARWPHGNLCFMTAKKV